VIGAEDHACEPSDIGSAGKLQTIHSRAPQTPGTQPIQVEMDLEGMHGIDLLNPKSSENANNGKGQ